MNPYTLGCKTVKELYTHYWGNDFDSFRNSTGGIIYGVEESGQMCNLFIENEIELGQYYDYEIVSVESSRDVYLRPLIRKVI